MRNRKLVTLALSATALAGAMAVPATAADACVPTSTLTCETGVDVTTVVALPSSEGTRSITLASVGAAGVLVAGTPSVMSATVTETAKLGTATWSVTAVASALTSTTPAAVIPASAMSMGAATAPAAVGCLSVAITTSQCTVAAGAGGALNTAQNVFTVTGERTDVAYTGTYVGTAPVTLTLPSGTPASTYTGKVTFTLVQ